MFRVAFCHVKCIILNEVSMLSSDNLNAVYCRLRQIAKGSTNRSEAST